MTAQSKKELAFTLFDQGKRPSDPEVKELGVKPETLYRYYQFWKGNNPSNHTMIEKPSPSSGKPSPTTMTTEDKGLTSFIRVVPKVQVMSYTPIMQRAQEAAVNELGWPSDMSLEDFIDTVLYFYFKRKGILLEAYVVQEKVNIPHS